MFVHLLYTGVYSPNNHGAFPPILTYPRLLSATPHPHPPHPHKQFLDILYAILCNFMHVFSELWKQAVGDNDTKNEKNI